MARIADIVKAERERMGLSQSELARVIGVSPQSIQQLESGLVARPRYLPELSEALGFDLREFERSGRRLPVRSSSAPAAGGPASDGAPEASAGHLHPTTTPQAVPAGFGRKDLPVYASAQGGPDGMLVSYEPIEWVQRPERLVGVPDAFAMYVVNDSMEPKYRQGDLLLIHPTRPVRRGDSVLLIKLSENQEHSAFIKELVSMDADKVTFKQYNPAKTFKIERRQVQGLHLVIGAYWGG